MLWPEDKFTCLIETTTYCNAKCPQCSRTNPDGLGYSGIAPLKHVTFQEWKDSYAKSYDSIRSFHFSGQWGDAFMNPDIKDIMYHIIDNSECNISFCTNASMRDGDFWWDLGVKLKGRVTGHFDVDGLTQENHEMYRRNTNLKLVKDNVEAWASTGARTVIFSVVFKHNQGDMDGISKWAESIGAKHDPMQSNRFWAGPTFTYSYKGKDYTLEQTTDPRFLESFSEDRATRDYRHYDNVTRNIRCRWGERNKIFVDEYLNVWPCCYWHIRHFRYSKEDNTNPAFSYFIKCFMNGDFNLKNKSLEEIMNSSFYTWILEESFDVNPTRICKVICGALSSEDEQPQ